MTNSNSINLSTHELATSLALCGHESMASQVLNSMEIIEDGEEVKRFILQTEISLKSKGYWDDNRSTMLVAGVEDLMHLLVHSKKKVRCIREDRVLLIHLIDQKNVLVQDIGNQMHSFSLKKLEDGVTNLLLKHFRLDSSDYESTKDIQTLLLSNDMFDELHQLDHSVLERMINDENLEAELRHFFYDFKKNLQQFDNLSFMEMDYIKDFMDIKHVIFMLPSEQFIWHLDYEKIQEEEVYIVPTETNDYCSRLNQDILDYFLQETAANS
ncbi:hypothetical protein [Bacillus sp. CECT 9360]|uniref:hypothetical protein n=1 Tax=Bacillus sp. CECT 9360 TaxID=2845821 RepID=UPI001E534C8D|nr:hypothetical protein [Bacillus sp. CECT 9360]CAH0345443.1 hypothetical protein BCI9360_01729 [Bacillus sp. CECT 9360]